MKSAAHIFLLALTSALTLAACARADAPAELPKPVWSAEALRSLREVAEAAPAEGLAPEAESLALLQTLEARRQADPSASARLDTVATALFDELASSFASGAVPPSAVDPDWRIPTQQADLPALHAALSAGARPAALLRPLLPASADYRAMRDALAHEYADQAHAGQVDGPDRATRILRLRANMERWRWLPRTLPERRIEVRIAQFETILYRPGQNATRHAAIVGRSRTPTPRFVAQIGSVTLNPAWEPPSSIIAELLPRFRADPGAAAREGFDVLTRDGAIVPPDAVDWQARPFPYRLRQLPGPNNPLGVVRFNLPNPYAVYLHDTSNRELFNRHTRAFSHGCVRVADPLSLTEAVLDDEAWSVTALQTAVLEGETRNIALASPLPVYFLYFTATGGAAGEIDYAEDIYARDRALVIALDRPEAALVAAHAPAALTCGGEGAPT